MESIFLIYLFVFVFGTVIGSFLNVLIDRLPRNESIIKTRSHCEHCRHVLSWVDLVPVFSYVFLGGRCRYCHKHIGYFYPFVETMTGLLFVFIVNFLIPNEQALFVPEIQALQVINLLVFLTVFYYWVLFSCLIVIFFTDFKYGLIPFKIVLFAFIVTFIYLLTTPLLLSHILTGIATGAFFFLLFLITRGKGLGFGDVVYAFLMGFILGFPQVIAGLYLAFLSGAIIALTLVVAGKKKLHGGSIPFGPFLVTGTVIGLFYGEYLIKIALHYLV